MRKHINTLFAVQHTEIASKQSITGKDTVSEWRDTMKIFKSRNRAIRFVNEWYEKWPPVGRLPHGGATILDKELPSDTCAKVEYSLDGIGQICQICSVQEIEYDDTI